MKLEMNHHQQLSLKTSLQRAGRMLMSGKLLDHAGDSYKSTVWSIASGPGECTAIDWFEHLEAWRLVRNFYSSL